MRCAVAFLALALTACGTDGAMVAPPSTRASAPSSTLALPIAPFLPASVANRGALSVLGYTTEPGPGGGLVATVYFMAPEVASKIPAGDPPPAPCEPAPTVRGTGTEHVTVDVELRWIPKTPAALTMDADCTAYGHGPTVKTSYVVGPVSPSAKLFTGTPDGDVPLPFTVSETAETRK
jgi:hypothetical protein